MSDQKCCHASASVVFVDNDDHDETQAAKEGRQTLASNSTGPICIVCDKEVATFQPISCDCAFSYCKKCAMKCATGGKCKKCNEFFGSLKLSHT